MNFIILGSERVKRGCTVLTVALASGPAFSKPDQANRNPGNLVETPSHIQK